MSTSNITAARAVADPVEKQLLACVEIEAESERVFRALTSEEITAWWVRPGVFDTREWSCDMRVGGRWRASGISRGQPYVQEGEFLEIDPPHKLIHTWDGAGRPDLPSTVTYLVERFEKGTRLNIRQTGFVSSDVCNAFAIGWETSLKRLAEILVP
jgi:uncharacterized protein YndB with AHSA1/START domain